MVDKQDDHQKALDYYKDNFEGKTVKFDAQKYRDVENEKSRLTRMLGEKKFEIKQFDAKAATYEQDKGVILDQLVPIEGPNADLQIKLRIWKENLKETKALLAEEDVDIAPLDMEDPRKASQQNKQNEKNEPQKHSGGLGMGGL